MVGILMWLTCNTAPIPPIQPIPPIGTKQCQQVYVCDSTGKNCQWITICQ